MNPVVKLSEYLMGYFDPNRHYHNFDHIQKCLSELKEVMHLVDDFDSLYLAILFHDIVYNCHSARNEIESADIAGECLPDTEIYIVEKIKRLIIATTHVRQIPYPHKDTNYMVDIDLASLGYDFDSFRLNTIHIRQEYHHLPLDVFCAGRINILNKFLSRESIYFTYYFRNKYEVRARQNIKESIVMLSENRI